MIHKRILRAALFVWALLLVPGTIRAQTNGFSFTAPLSFSEGRDKGFLVGRDAVDDLVTILTGPEFSYGKVDARTNFSLKYQPEVELFKDHTELNAWNHSAGLHLEHKFSPRLTFNLGDSFVGTHDPARRLPESFFRLPRSYFQENSFYSGFMYQASRATSFDFRFDNAVTTIDLVKLVTPGVLDYMSNSGTAGVSHSFGPKHQLSLSYTAMKLRALGGANLLGGTDLTHLAHYLSPSYRYMSGGWIVDLSVSGIRRTRYSYATIGEVQRRVRGAWFSVGYQGYTSFVEAFLPRGGAPIGPGGVPVNDVRLVSAVFPSSRLDAVTAGFRGSIRNRVGIEIKALRSVNKIQQGSREIRSGFGHARLDYRLTDRLVLFTAAEYYGENVNELVLTRLSRARYFGGMEVSLSRFPKPLERYRSGDRSEPAAASSSRNPEERQ